VVQFKLFKTIKPRYWHEGENHTVELNEQETNALLVLKKHHSLTDPQEQGPLDTPTYLSLKEKELVRPHEGRMKTTKQGWAVIRKLDIWIAIDQAYSKTLAEKIKEAAADPCLEGEIRIPDFQWPFVKRSGLPVQCLLEFIAYSDALQQVVDELNAPPNFGNENLYALEDLQVALIFAAELIGTTKPEL
jgi:hypothetical protein